MDGGATKVFNGRSGKDQQILSKGMKDHRPRYSFGPFELDLESHVLLRDGALIPLKPKLFDLLLTFVEHPGRLITKEELHETLWRGQFVEEANITQSVYELRKALGNDEGRRLIANVPRRGYRFEGEVFSRSAGEGATPDRIETVAVLPFTALAPEDSDPSLELGIAETLITALSRLSSIVVRPTGSIRKFGSEGTDPLAAGREVNVDAVVSGSIQRTGDRLRVSARVVRTASGEIVWAGSVDEPLMDLFALQDAICERLVEALALEIPRGAGPLVRRHTADPEVHRLFLQCRYHWQKWTPENWLRAIAYGREASERDPRHAPSYSWMAAAHVALAIAGVTRPREAFPEATHLLEKAFAIDGALSEAHEVRGAIALFYDWNWDAAEKSLHAALELNPNNAGARDLRALLRVVQGRNDEAIREVVRARDIDPLSLLVNTDVGYVHYYARRFGESIEQFRRALTLDPWFAHARFGLGFALLAHGDTRDAITSIEAAVEHFGRARETCAELGYALAVGGERESARAILSRLDGEAASGFIDPWFRALVSIGLGEHDAAFALLDRAVEERSRELIYLGANPVADPLRNDPRFHRLLRRVGI